AADRVQERDAVVGEKLCAFAEKNVVEADADMLEHADRHDAVEAAVDVAIILKPEAGIARQAALERPVLGALILLLRQRDAGHLGVGNFREIERQTAPAATDVEHLGAGRDAQLRRQMALLGQLRVVERLVARFEIGAAILLVAVEEEPVQPAVEVVVMGDVVAGAGSWIELLQATEQIAHEPRQQGPDWRNKPFLPEQERQHVDDRAAFDDKSAVHIGFAEFHLGIEQHAALRLRRREAHGNRRAAAVAESVRPALCRRDRKRSTADEPSQEHWQQPIHGRLHARLRSPPAQHATIDALRQARGRSRAVQSIIVPEAPLFLAVIKTKSSLTSNAAIMFSLPENASPFPHRRGVGLTIMAPPTNRKEAGVFRGVAPAIGLFVGLLPAMALAQTNIDQGKS